MSARAKRKAPKSNASAAAAAEQAARPEEPPPPPSSAATEALDDATRQVTRSPAAPRTGQDSDEVAEVASDLWAGVEDFIAEDVIAPWTDAFGDRRENYPQRASDPDVRAEAQRRVRTLTSSIDGWGTDDDGARASMRGASPEVIEAMEAEWAHRHRGRDMREDIMRDVSGSLEEEMNGLLTGDPVQQAEASIARATHGIDSDHEGLVEAIRAVPADQRGRLTELLGGEEAARRMLQREAADDNADEVSLALLRGEDDRAAALELQNHLVDGDSDEAIEQLDALPEESRADVIAAFDELEDQASLAQSIRGSVDDGLARERALALMNGQHDRADAYALEQAADRAWYETDAAAQAAVALACGPVGLVMLTATHADERANGNGQVDWNPTDTEALFEITERRDGESPEEYDARIERLRAAHEEIRGHGALERLFDDELGRGSHDRARVQSAMAHQGEMDAETMIAYATDSEFWGTNDHFAVRGAELAGEQLPPERREQLRHQMVDGGLFSETSGATALEIEHALAGQPRNAREQLERERELHRLERGNLGRFLADAHSGSGFDYDEHLDQLEECIDDGGNVVAGQEARYEELLTYIDEDRELYHARRDEAVEVAAQAAAITAAGVVTVASAGTLSPVAVGALAATAGGMATTTTHIVGQGGTYENEELGTDILNTGIGAAGGALGPAIAPTGSALGQRIASGVVTEALDQGTELVLSDQPVGWSQLGEAGVDSVGNIAAEEIGDFTEGAVQGRNPSQLRQHGANALGGVAEGVVDRGTELATYRDGAEEAVERIAMSGARGGARSLAIDVGEAAQCHDIASNRVRENARGTDLRDMIAQQAHHDAEIMRSAPLGESDATMTVGRPTVRTPSGPDGGVTPPDGHIPSAHTHPDACIDPRMMLPGGSDITHAGTARQAVGHDRGLTMFNNRTMSSDVTGLVDGNEVEVGRRVSSATFIPDTRVLVDHDPTTGGAVVWPAADNPNQTFLPIEFPTETLYAPGRGPENVSALSARRDAAMRESEARAIERERAPSETRRVIGHTREQDPIYEGDALPGVWRDLDGQWHVPTPEE